MKGIGRSEAKLPAPNPLQMSLSEMARAAAELAAESGEQPLEKCDGGDDDEHTRRLCSKPAAVFSCAARTRTRRSRVHAPKLTQGTARIVGPMQQLGAML